MPSTISLTSLHGDVLLAIFSFMDPLDILRLRKTCKVMKAATMQPTIWIGRLAKIVRDNKLFGPTYQFDEMSVNDLERAVFFPSKLLDLAEKSEENLITPFSCRVLTNPLGADEVESKGTDYRYRDDGDIDDIIMIPGGRFLFTMSDKHRDGVTYTKLWDLGQPNTKPSRITLLSKFAGQERIRATAPTPDGLGIRVITATTASEVYQIKVYQIFPLSPKPHFEQIAGVKLSEYIRSVNVSGNRIICSTSPAPELRHGFEIVPQPELMMGFILVWDFIDNASTVLRPTYPLPQELHLWGNHIITFHSNTVFLWSIPPLTSGSPQFERSTPANAPTWTSVLSTWSADRAGAKNRMLRPHTGWIPADASPQYLIAESVQVEPNEDLTQYAVYRIDSSWAKNFSKSSTDTHSETDDAKQPQPRHIVDFDPYYFGVDFRMFPSSAPPLTSKDDIFLTFDSNGSIVMAAIPLPDVENKEVTQGCKFCCLSIGRLDATKCPQFCPATGRGCSLGGYNRSEVRVFDYMLP